MHRTCHSMSRWTVALRVALLLCVVLLGLGLASDSAHAQSAPTLIVKPDSGADGSVVLLSGEDFTPGGYAGTILWNGAAVETIFIPDGGAFTVPFVTPLGAAPTVHQIGVCAGDPCRTGALVQTATAPFAVRQQSPDFGGTVAYIYASDDNTAASFVGLLKTSGFDVAAIPLEQAPGVDLSATDLIIIASDTGSGESWGATSEQFKHIIDSGVNLLGLGAGGHALFGQLKLFNGWPNGEFTTLNGESLAADRDLPFFAAPHDFAVALDNPLALYSGDAREIAVPLDNAPGGVLSQGYSAASNFSGQHANLLADGCRQLWGFEGSPAEMTRLGRSLFINAVVAAMTRSCDGAQPAAACVALQSPTQIPDPSLIDFDDLPNGSVIGDAYREQYGVRFEDSPTSRALIYGNEPDKAFSPPNVLSNDAPTGSSSAGVPLRIAFDDAKTHVGFYMGNGENADLTGVLTALDASGAVLCRATHNPVPEPRTHFIGLHDEAGRIASITLDYGSTSINESIDDLYFASSRRIRICRATGELCDPVAGARVHHIVNTEAATPTLISDGGGYIDTSSIDLGEQLWALADVTAELSPTLPVSLTARYSLYYTSDVVTVLSDAFGSDNVLEIYVQPDKPLMLYHPLVSSEWVLSETFKPQFAQRVAEASDFLYQFTDGQFALGDVSVYQDLTLWPDFDNAPQNADIRLYANDHLRPKAVAGGVVTEPVSDTVNPAVLYVPGFIMMGTDWNRFNKSPNDPSLPALVADSPGISSTAELIIDWPLALGHEFGHYLLFLFDTYFKLNAADETVENVYDCRGSAMGWMYEPENRGFIADEGEWLAKCQNTHAHQQLQRPEWTVIHDRHPWVRVPVSPTVSSTVAPDAPPVSLTSVSFVEPPLTSTVGLLGDVLFALDYQEDQGASSAARSLIIRDGRVIDQGGPAQDSQEVLLHGVKAGDRFCTVDINENATPDQQRFRYGCESIAAADTVLFLERDDTWTPVIDPRPSGATTWQISVTHVSVGLPLKAILYPENEANPTEIALTPAGDRYVGTFELPEVTPAAHVEVAVAETDEELDPARTAFIDFGIGGGTVPGAHWGDHAPVYSSDGVVEFYPLEPVLLGPDEFVSVVRYLNTYPLPANTVAATVPYGIVAHPPSLVSAGVINMHVPGTTAPVQAAGVQADGETALVIHYWTGSEWTPVETTVSDEPAGTRLASALSQGAGVYIALEVPVNAPGQVYLPLIRR